MTQRTYDANGWMHIPANPISKAGVFPYLGSEIGAPELSRVYNVFRPPEELQNAAATFAMLPLIDEHELLGEMGTSTDDRPPAGFTGENVVYEHPYLLAPIKITSDSLMREIARGKVELSPAYTCDWEHAPGVYEGQPYEFIQRIKAGNHIALVERGRTGADVAVLDRHFSFDTGGLLPMNLEELLAAVAALSPEEKAQLLGALSPATDEGKEDQATDAGEAAEVAQEAEAAAEAAGAAVEAEQSGDANAAESAAGEAVANAEAALAAAEDLKDRIASDAMHKAIKHIDARNAMAAKVKPFVGAVPAAAMDSAETIAAYALKKFGVKHDKGMAAAVVTGYLHGRKPQSEQAAAMDAKPVSAQSTASKFWKE